MNLRYGTMVQSTIRSGETRTGTGTFLMLVAPKASPFESRWRALLVKGSLIGMRVGDVVTIRFPPDTGWVEVEA